MSTTVRGRWSRQHAVAIAPGRVHRSVRILGVVVVVLAGSSAGLPADAQPAGGSAGLAPAATAGPGPLTVGSVVPAAPPDPSARIRVLLARLDVLDARAVVVRRQRTAVSVRNERADARATFDRAEIDLTIAEGSLGAARQRLESSSAFAYVRATGGGLVPALGGDFNRGAQEQEIFAATMDHHRRQVVEAEAVVAGATEGLEAARSALAAAQEVVTEHDERVAAARRVLDDARSELRAATALERRPTVGRPWQLTVEGPSAFSAAELTRWYAAQGRGSQASVPMADLVRAFLREGAAEGIRGDMAFAQSIHETGWFTNNDTIFANNFAGIGHCSACPAGYPFPTAELGVLAQIQLLKSYAQADPVYNRPRVDPDLNGPSGCCPTWNELTGVWASDPGYGPAILGDYAEMLEWLVADRTART